VAAPHKEGASWIELDNWNAKVERFLRARLVVTGIRQITKRNSRCQFCAAGLMPNHFATPLSYACNNRLPAAAGESTRGQGDNNCGSEF